jgi:hypothetical protein
MPDRLDPYLDAIRSALWPEGRDWLSQAVETISTAKGADSEKVLSRFLARAPRALGNAPLGAAADSVPTPLGTLTPAYWPASAAGRVALVLAALDRRQRDDAATLVGNVYRLGDAEEKGAVMRGLALFADGAQLKPLALDAGRTSNEALLGALALGNPYPAAVYSEDEFNAMVLKAIFVGLSAEGIYGLAARANPDLSRRCEDYAEERLAAGRSLPPGIWLALAPHAGPKGDALLDRFMADPDPAHRRLTAAAAASVLSGRPGWRARLTTRRRAETDPEIRAVIDAALSP